MTNGEVCTAVNFLFKAVCELKMQNNTNIHKSQMQFFRDFHMNRRALISSCVLYEYYASDFLTITKDELDLMREFLLTYLEKFDDTNITDVFISFNNNTIKFVFTSFERASKTNNTNTIIMEIENDIARNYDNSVFKIIDKIISSLPQDNVITKIKNVQFHFKTGNLISKYNENILGNYKEYEKYILNMSPNPIIPMIPDPCYLPPGPEPYSPFEPFQPAQPSEPVGPECSESVNFELFKKKIGSLNDDTSMPNINENNIKAAISRILEITTTEEFTNV